MKNVFIVHGAYGYPGENWFPWMKQELESRGFSTLVPQFPTPENQSFENWEKVLLDNIEFLSKDTIVVGHSTGPAFLINALNRSNIEVKSAFFVSGYVGLLGSPYEKFDEINSSIVDSNLDFDKFITLAPEIHLYHSNNDPYVSLEKAITFAKNLRTSVTVVPDAGHFNSKAGYDKFVLLRDQILESFSK